MKQYLLIIAAALGALALGACGKKETPQEEEPMDLLDMLYPNGQEKKDFEIQSKAMK